VADGQRTVVAGAQRGRRPGGGAARRLYAPRHGRWRAHAAPFDQASSRFNDGKVDAAGRYWVGTIYEPRDKPAAEMFVLEHGAVRKAWSGGMTNSNGLAFSPDGRTLYHADTAAHRIQRYAYDMQTGIPSEPQLMKQFSSDKAADNYGGRPDGAAVDSEGNYWVAMFEGGRILKLAPNGDELDEITLPLRCPTMVAFGGADLKTLYITSASTRPAEELAAMPLSGHLLQVRVNAGQSTFVVKFLAITANR
jgi:sugar lactone lactonase YvrE